MPEFLKFGFIAKSVLRVNVQAGVMLELNLNGAFYGKYVTLWLNILRQFTAAVGLSHLAGKWIVYELTVNK
jgi:hypothetical protein